VAAVYAHVQAVLLAPSLLYLLIQRQLSRVARITNRAVFLTLAGGSVAIALGAGLFTPLARFYLPVFATESTYGVLSWTHLLDVGNELYLLLPSLGVLVVMAVLGRRNPQRPLPKASEQNVGRKSVAWFTRREEWHLAALLLLPTLLYLLLFNPEIGMARDWDLFTIMSLGLYPLALLMVNRCHAYGGSARKIFRRTLPILVATALLTVTWVGTHASWTRSAARFERILEYDQTHASYAYENLAVLYEKKGQMDRAIKFAQAALRVSGSSRQSLRLSKYYQEAGRADLAILVMRTAVELEPQYHDGRVWLIVLLEQAARYTEILELARDGTRIHPTENVYWFYLGESSMALGDTATAVSAYQRAQELNPPPAARQRIEQQLQVSRPSP
jgi:predicted negative regulator of RcsB-dependent stress response